MEDKIGAVLDATRRQSPMIHAWSQPVWVVLRNTMLTKLPEGELSEEWKAWVVWWFNTAVPPMITCPSCESHWKQHVKEMPPEALHTAASVWMWLVTVQNRVRHNPGQRKAQLSFMEALQSQQREPLASFMWKAVTSGDVPPEFVEYGMQVYMHGDAQGRVASAAQPEPDVFASQQAEVWKEMKHKDAMKTLGQPWWEQVTSIQQMSKTQPRLSVEALKEGMKAWPVGGGFAGWTGEMRCDHAGNVTYEKDFTRPLPPIEHVSHEFSNHANKPSCTTNDMTTWLAWGIVFILVIAVIIMAVLFTRQQAKTRKAIAVADQVWTMYHTRTKHAPKK
jgi:hypothetical protein